MPVQEYLPLQRLQLPETWLPLQREVSLRRRSKLPKSADEALGDFRFTHQLEPWEQ